MTELNQRMDRDLSDEQHIPPFLSPCTRFLQENGVLGNTPEAYLGESIEPMNFSGGEERQAGDPLAPDYDQHAGPHGSIEYHFLGKVKHRRKKPQTSSNPGPPPNPPPVWEKELTDALREHYYLAQEPIKDVTRCFGILYLVDAKESDSQTIVDDLGMRKNGVDAHATCVPELGQKRKRAAAGLPKPTQHTGYQLYRQQITGRLRELTPEQASDGLGMLLRVRALVKGLLDTKKRTWTWEPHLLRHRAAERDSFEDWSMVYDQFHSASLLVQGKQSGKAIQLAGEAMGRLRQLMTPDDPWVISFFWKVMLTLNGISTRLNAGAGFHVARIMRLLTQQYSEACGEEFPIAQLLRILQKVPAKDLKPTMGILYMAAIDTLESFERQSTHPFLLGMRAHYHAQYTGCFDMLHHQRYRDLIGKAQTETQVSNGQQLMILVDFLQVLWREKKDIDSAKGLAIMIDQRTRNMPISTWTSAVHARFVAIKYLSTIYWVRRENTDSFKATQTLAEGLGKGDDQCRIRAAELHDTMARRYYYNGQLLECKTQVDNADKVREGIIEGNGGSESNVPPAKASQKQNQKQQLGRLKPKVVSKVMPSSKEQVEEERKKRKQKAHERSKWKQDMRDEIEAQKDARQEKCEPKREKNRYNRGAIIRMEKDKTPSE